MASPEDSEFEYDGRLLSEWLADLGAPDAETREEAVLTLYAITLACQDDGKPAPSVMISSLIPILRDPEGPVRGWAARALGALGKQACDALPHLMAILATDEEDIVRAQIAEAIGELGGARDAAPLLLRLLRDGADVVREAAGAALEKADLSGLGVENELRLCLSDKSAVVRTWVCWSLWGITKKAGELLPLLLESIQDERARLDAARLLCRMKDQAVSTLPALLALRRDQLWAVRLQAVRATINIPCCDELALPVLEELRDDQNEVVRSYVAGALKRRGQG